MLKIHIGLLNTEEDIFFIIKFEGMSDYHRATGNIFRATENNEINISSIHSPDLDIDANILFLPGEEQAKDHSPIFFKLTRFFYIYSHTIVERELKYIKDKIIYSINKYNNLLTNIQLYNNRAIDIIDMSPAKIMQERLWIKYSKEPSKPYININTDIPDYYNLR